jgi:hypothetical protein
MKSVYSSLSPSHWGNVTMATPTEAAVRYHGKTKPPQKKNHKMELDVLVSLFSRGVLRLGVDYVVTNVSGKLISEQHDKLTYRIAFSPEHPFWIKEQANIRIAPALKEFRRREGRVECGFHCELPNPLPAEVLQAGFFCSPTNGFSAVLSADRLSVLELYFVLEDVNLEPAGAAQWRVQPDSSALLEKICKRWVPLAPVHPDPAVDPGVPIEKRPQGDPRWYYFRNDCAHYALFHGKLSGSRMWKFIGGGIKLTDFLTEVDFKGNNLTRCGRMTECKMVLAQLLFDKDLVMYEAGSYPHPTIPDVCAAPDAVMVRKKLSFDTLPEWHKALIKTAAKQKLIDANAIDFSRGVFESKVMPKLDAKHKLGPVMKPEYLCQVYMEMICTNTYWATVQRYCVETGECRMYQVFRRPQLASRLERCIVRMIKEMIGGTPYVVAVDHQTNRELLKEFRAQSAWYNSPGTTRYKIVPWPKEPMAQLEKLLWGADTFANTPDNRARKTVAAEIEDRIIAATATTTKRGKKKVAPPVPKKRQLELEPGDEPLIDPTKAQLTLWAGIAHCNRELTRCVNNGDWDMALAEGAIKSQILSYIELEKQVVAECVASAKKKNKPLALDPKFLYTPPPKEQKPQVVAAVDEEEEEDEY